jgi:hypothetical protein
VRPHHHGGAPVAAGRLLAAPGGLLHCWRLLASTKGPARLQRPPCWLLAVGRRGWWWRLSRIVASALQLLCGQRARQWAPPEAAAGGPTWRRGGWCVRACVRACEESVRQVCSRFAAAAARAQSAWRLQSVAVGPSKATSTSPAASSHRQGWASSAAAAVLGAAAAAAGHPTAPCAACMVPIIILAAPRAT